MNAVAKTTTQAPARASSVTGRPAQPRLACLGLGSNIEPQQHLARAVAWLARTLEVVAVSSVWETPAVGSPGPDFLNAAVLVHTWLPPDSLKWGVLRPIETRLGRLRSQDKNAPRTIDIDLLVYGGQVLDPHLWQFAHLALPVAELLPDLKAEPGAEPLAVVAERLKHSSPARKVAGFR